MDRQLYGQVPSIFVNHTVSFLQGQIQLCGLSDPLMTKDPDKMLYTLNFFKEEKERRKLPFSLLLSHRPELLGLYSKFPIDLILSGHAHGGQFRIPLLCPSGLFAPNQGWLPKYNLSSKFQLNDC